jgi:hypothetical protein
MIEMKSIKENGARELSGIYFDGEAERLVDSIINPDYNQAKKIARIENSSLEYEFTPPDLVGVFVPDENLPGGFWLQEFDEKQWPGYGKRLAICDGTYDVSIYDKKGTAYIWNTYNTDSTGRTYIFNKGLVVLKDDADSNEYALSQYRKKPSSI